GGTVELRLYLGGDLDRDDLVAERDHATVETAAQDHLVVALDARHQLVVLPASSLLGSQEHEIEDREHQDDEPDVVEWRRPRRLAAGLRPCRAHATPKLPRPR